MFGITLDRKGEQPLSRQIFTALSRGILQGDIPQGTALPSTRQLAAELGVSRGTVTEGYELLASEGYVSSRQGARYRVAEGLVLASAPADGKAPEVEREVPIRHDFRTGLPELGEFPLKQWRGALQQAADTCRPADLLYGDPAGYLPLRREIARWLFRQRGIRMEPEAVLVTAGATHALELAVQLLEGDVAVEDPCHMGIRRILEYGGKAIRPVPVDRQGICTHRIPMQGVGGVYVTPSHQFPLGGVLPAARRVELVRMARERNLLLLEDDYDGELRYGGPSLTPLCALDPDRVIYMGTFSKSLFPALRTGYALVPRRLREEWLRRRRFTDIQNPIFSQMALAAFLREGRMDRYLRRMRRVYAARRDKLVALLRERLPAAEIIGEESGLHLAVRVPGRRFSSPFYHRCCREEGLALSLCGYYQIKETKWSDTLLLGFGRIDEGRLPQAVGLLAELIYKEEAK